MFVLLLILLLVLFGLGFLSPVWWVAAAVLAFASTRFRRDRGGGGQDRGHGPGLGEYRDYQRRRDRQERWDRLYSFGPFVLLATVMALSWWEDRVLPSPPAEPVPPPPRRRSPQWVLTSSQNYPVSTPR